MSENIKVVVRLRPISKTNEPTFFSIKDQTITLSVSENERTNIHHFSFDTIFPPDTTQEDVFLKTAKNAVEWVCQGYNSTIFAYGQSGSGKSFTMFGHEGKEPKLKGIVPRACETLFKTINSGEEILEATLKCSFIELYRETIRDLLAQKDTNLKIRQNPLRGVYVQGLLEKFVYTPEDILETIKEGTLQRTVASTSLNNVSSRSHAVLTLTLTQKLNDGSEVTSRLNLIDLAGSENVGKSEAQGTTLAEAQTINKSLSCLGNVIFALTEKSREHIPYRDSKLTYLLQDSLGGNSRTILIATINPLSSFYFESLSTLKFAQRAKLIKNAPKVNRNESITTLLKTIDTLTKRIQELEKERKVYKKDNISGCKECLLSKDKEVALIDRIELLEAELQSGQTRYENLEELYYLQRNESEKNASQLADQKAQNYLTIISK